MADPRLISRHGKFRPLVVLDPEDREQVERFRTETLRMLCDHIGVRAVDDAAFTETDLANAMQAALRSLIAPPVEEPQGLGAVVGNAVGDRFVRTAKRDFPWVRVDQPDANAFHWTEHRSLDGHAPARVLSEGWSE